MTSLDLVHGLYANSLYRVFTERVNYVRDLKLFTPLENGPSYNPLRQISYFDNHNVKYVCNHHITWLHSF